ncbi:nucleoside hydrolase [Arthrobacter woluwensis]|uniref:Purine nucleosidase n=1 Tax=Arthrobacter woluwensis TaxID=156980 RepID=A0A1H4JHI0_9MICC|nr:nucleoside hydrolase [Arthrobacter woluwensis]SEB45505.1 purine nucleosidase [Arthrobacter woluwensis]
MDTIPVYLDCDTGIDDALAIAHLLASPRAELLGVGTVSGNSDAAQCARNTLDLLALAGRPDIPVAVGCHDFQTVAYGGGSPHVHGDNGLGGVELPRADREPEAESAAEMLIRLAREQEGKLHVIAVAPLTNLAEALCREPRLPELVAHVTIMGGAALAPGNITAAAEANIFHDPEAAAEVLAAPWPVTLVPLDVTMTEVMEEGHRRRLLDSGKAVPETLARMLEHYFEFYRGIFGRPSSAMHDPLAAAIALGEVAVTLGPVVRVAVETGQGPARGATVCDLRGRYRGDGDQDGATCRVVLEAEPGFPDALVDGILRAF